MRARRSSYLPLVLGLPAAVAGAAEVPRDPFAIERPWAVGVSAQVDDLGNEGLLTSVNWNAAGATWLTAAVGRRAAPADRADVVAETWTGGIDHDFGPVGLSLSFDRWGDADALTTEALDAALYVQRPGFRAGLARSWRDIEIEFTATGPLDRSIERTAALTSTGLEIFARVGIGEDWQLTGSHVEYAYSRNLELLPRIDALNWLSASALTLAYAFVDRRSRLGFERTLGAKVLTVGASRHESAVDRARFRSVDAALLFPAGARIDIEVDLGRSASDLAADGYYGGVLVLVYGGR